MDGMKDWLFPSTQIGALIRFRPLSLDLFYRRGLDPWSEQEASVSDFCRLHALNENGFLRNLADLPPVDPGTHWEEQPCYHLIDYLTDEHRTIMHTDIPAIRYLLDMGFPEAEGTGTVFRTLTKSIGDFTDQLRVHFRQEEENIFPIMLANDFRFTFRPPFEEPHPPAWSLHVSGRLLEEEERLKGTLDAFMDCAGLSGGSRGETSSSKAYLSVAWLMKTMGAKLRAHSRLEMEVLFPIASRVERELLSVVPARD